MGLGGSSGFFPSIKELDAPPFPDFLAFHSIVPRDVIVGICLLKSCVAVLFIALFNVVSLFSFGLV
ncbi:hypothetical protein D3C80_2161270 [compost metagenome]